MSVPTETLPAIRYTVEDIRLMARAVAESRMFGMDAAQAMTLMLLSQAKGIHPIQAVERYHVIQGRPAMKADAMLADFQAAGGRVEWIERSDSAWEGNFLHPIQAPEGVRVRFTIADAKRAELLKNAMWAKYPGNMLRARVISNAIRTIMPGIVAGIYTPEEVADFADVEPRNVTVREAPGPPRDVTPGRDEPAPAPRAEDAPRAEPWASYVARVCRTANDDWLNELKTEGVENARHKDLVNQHQLTNHVASRAVEGELIDEATITDGRGKRDRVKALEAVAGLFARFPGKTRAAVQAHLKELRQRGRAEFGIFDPEQEEGPDQAGAESPAEGVEMAGVAAGESREPGQEG